MTSPTGLLEPICREVSTARSRFCRFSLWFCLLLIMYTREFVTLTPCSASLATTSPVFVFGSSVSTSRIAFDLLTDFPLLDFGRAISFYPP